MAKNNGSRGAGTFGAPTADNVQRKNEAGNVSVTGEKHDSAKAEKVSAASRFNAAGVGPTQPTRQNGDGNTTVTGEMHGSAKAERVPASKRF